MRLKRLQGISHSRRNYENHKKPHTGRPTRVVDVCDIICKPSVTRTLVGWATLQFTAPKLSQLFYISCSQNYTNDTRTNLTKQRNPGFLSLVEYTNYTKGEGASLLNCTFCTGILSIIVHWT